MAECLLAVAVTGILLAGLAPPLFILQATRVQNARIEQAVTIAQGEIDDIGVKIALGKAQFTSESAFTAVLPPVSTASSLNSQAPPTTTQTCSIMPTSATVGCIRTLGSQEYVVQQFRTAGTATRDFSNFNMQVRVYSRRIFQTGGVGAATTNPGTPMKATFTAYPDASGRPLVTLTTTQIQGSYCNDSSSSTACLLQ
ncbi:hypothetical protein RIF25_07335 [Thermosynechococcaceae cyanobacterium BACA0444]|uniref:Uncharacterized protein n=2 Tax=Pseudocalidococcus TaxID=3110321 RepID=A0AAE4JZB1_9CYAN|nr:hypothetical protein [Pseudocalidococcus azoricus BACA0444]